MKKFLAVAAATLMVAGFTMGAASAKHRHHHRMNGMTTGSSMQGGMGQGGMRQGSRLPGNNAELTGNNGNSAGGNNSSANTNNPGNGIGNNAGPPLR